MIDSKKWPQIAVAAILAISCGSDAIAREKMEKCYGVAEKGKNHCGANHHGCEGKAVVDNDPNEWTYVPAGTCERMGGRTHK